MEYTSQNIVYHDNRVTRADRHQLNQHKSFVLWLTGLSGSGKSTVSVELEKVLHDRGVRSYVIDGDNLRHGLNADLGFKPEDRKENIRRVGEVSKLFVDAGLVVLAAFISPYTEDRENVRNLFEPGEFVEIFVKCPVEVCIKRDPKGLYEKAIRGEITNFTGISAPYEEPVNPELILDTNKNSFHDCINIVVDYLLIKNLI
ncbi:adenylyl-sulfate kinase [Paenibacillus silvae]|uniref:Adenylyl-sulfate kinase n=1 Tax=Paenibacillus silvae TaxID=1325358 RepID=A0ABQ1ZFQ7_9BACL|nr:adenylyl-sulfate kinase [Paenibacillus silvae]GGH63972.1 adenylyl-sulfate kinase [Paenibacillus silvae]